MKEGYIHSFESFGTVDGPGVRFVTFMQGCPLRCLYCHNPDTWEVGCGQKYTPEAVAQEALRYKKYWGQRGGVTVTGGEPLLQIDFVIALFTLLKEKNVHCAVDTCGITFVKENEKSYAKHLQLMEKTDLFLLDIKHIENEKCIQLTGHGNRNTLDFAQFLSDNNKTMYIRYVLLPEYTDSDEVLIKTRRFLDKLKTVAKIEVLPYHTMGAAKYKALNMQYILEGVQPPTIEKVQRAKEILGVESYEK